MGRVAISAPRSSGCLDGAPGVTPGSGDGAPWSGWRVARSTNGMGALVT
ncbi:Uncharacterised protein [Bordetella pertussis]|nr:Uncharacterised protein [Bordetella pertussis]